MPIPNEGSGQNFILPGYRFCQSRGVVKMNQKTCILKMLDRFGMNVEGNTSEVADPKR